MHTLSRTGFPSVAARLIRLVLVQVALWGVAGVHAFPERPVRLLVGGPVGGTVDLISRVFAHELAQASGQPVVVENRPGASGLLAMQALLAAPPDGHTLMVGPSSLVTEIPHIVHLPFDPLQQLVPLAELGRTGLLLVTSSELPARSYADMVGHLQRRGQPHSYASYSAGTLSHILGWSLAQALAVDMVHAAYRGSPPALADVAAGRVTLMFDAPPSSLPLIQDGRLRAFATTAARRMSTLPDVPTMDELGHGALTATVWLGLWSRTDTPQALRASVARQTHLVATSGPMQAKLLRMGMEPGRATEPEALAVALREASLVQAYRLKTIGFKLE
jgi:tripartite-type tricarboxylate transporter receptor subunit TctC